MENRNLYDNYYFVMYDAEDFPIYYDNIRELCDFTNMQKKHVNQKIKYALLEHKDFILFNVFGIRTICYFYCD